MTLKTKTTKFRLMLKNGCEINVDISKWTPGILDLFLQYGLKKLFNDRLSGVKKPTVAMFQEVQDLLDRGIWQKTRQHEIVAASVMLARTTLHGKGVAKADTTKIKTDADVVRVASAHGLDGVKFGADMVRRTKGL